MEGMKKKEVKEKLKEYCWQASIREEDRIPYNPLVNYRQLNFVIDNAWKKTIPLREIQSVEISKEVVDWFLKLEDSMILDEECIRYEKKRRPGIVISGNKALNWNRVKYLFTLFIWTKIQENYLEKPNMHYLSRYAKRFKEDAGLNSGFNMQRERNYLFDLGFIDINYALGIDVKFIRDYDVFSIPVTDENRVVLSSDVPGEGDLYFTGYG